MKSASSLKRVQLLYFGGLVFLDKFDPDKVKHIFKSYLDLQFVADVEVTILDDIVGADVDGNLAIRIARVIQESYDEYDGFVVIQHMDNAIFTAVLTQFLCTQLGKPIVFSGVPFGNVVGEKEIEKKVERKAEGKNEDQSKEVMHEINLRTNLVTAVQLAGMDFGEIAVVINGVASRAVRAIQQPTSREYQLGGFYEPLVTVARFGVGEEYAINPRSNKPFRFTEEFSADVEVQFALPGQKEFYVCRPNTKALIIQGNTDQPLPNGYTLPDDIPVLVCGYGQQKFTQANVLLVNNATFLTTLTKTMALLPQVNSTEEFLKKFNKPLWHEFVTV